jgi:hypothetical protein
MTLNQELGLSKMRGCSHCGQQEECSTRFEHSEFDERHKRCRINSANAQLVERYHNQHAILTRAGIAEAQATAIMETVLTMNEDWEDMKAARGGLSLGEYRQLIDEFT